MFLLTTWVIIRSQAEVVGVSRAHGRTNTCPAMHIKGELQERGYLFVCVCVFVRACMCDRGYSVSLACDTQCSLCSGGPQSEPRGQNSQCASCLVLNHD